MYQQIQNKHLQAHMRHLQNPTTKMLKNKYDEGTCFKHYAIKLETITRTNISVYVETIRCQKEIVSVIHDLMIPQ